MNSVLTAFSCLQTVVQTFAGVSPYHWMLPLENVTMDITRPPPAQLTATAAGKLEVLPFVAKSIGAQYRKNLTS